MQRAVKQPALPNFEIHHANTRCPICLCSKSETPELNQAEVGRSSRIVAYQSCVPGEIVSLF